MKAYKSVEHIKWALIRCGFTEQEATDLAPKLIGRKFEVVNGRVFIKENQ